MTPEPSPTLLAAAAKPPRKSRPGSETWATPEEVAKDLGVSPKLIYKLAASDRTFPAVKLSNVIRIRRARLDTWLERQHPAKALKKTPKATQPSGTPLRPTSNPAPGQADSGGAS